MRVIDVEKVKILFKLLQYGMTEKQVEEMDSNIDCLITLCSFEVEEEKGGAE